MSEIPYFRNYCWKKGKPVGLQEIDPFSEESFKILTDPYKKRFSIERYKLGKFCEVVYDSNVFDFRLLTREEDQAWQREVIEETETSVHSIIRSMDDRIILQEEAEFSGTLCLACTIKSPHGIVIARQKMLHQSLGDSFNGVTLCDILSRPIVIKRYAKDELTGNFTTLLCEEWEIG